MCVGKIISHNKKHTKDIKCGYIDENGDIKIPLIFDDVCAFSNGRAKVILNGKTGVINTDGVFIIEIDNKELYVSGYDFVTKTYDSKSIIVSKNGKEGLLNNDMTIALPIEYSLQDFAPYGYIARSWMTIEGLCGIYDTEGKQIVECKYQDIGKASEGFCIIKYNYKYGYLDLKKQKELPCIYDNVKPFAEGLGCVKKGDLYGYIYQQGGIAIPYQYEEAFPFEGDIARVVINILGKGRFWALINKKGDIITDYKWYAIHEFHEGFAIAEDREQCIENISKWTFINKKGIPISNNRYKNVEDFNNGKAKVCITVNSKYYYGYIDTNGNVEIKNNKTGKIRIIPYHYQYISETKEGMIMIMKNGKYGFADKDFNFVTPIKFTNAEPFDRGKAIVWQDSHWAKIDKKGYFWGTISSNNYDMAIKLRRCCFIVIKERKTGIINTKGEIIIPIEFDAFTMSSMESGWFTSNSSIKNFVLFISKNKNLLYCIKSGKIFKDFDDVHIYGETAIVFQNKKSGYLDSNGRSITPVMFDKCEAFHHGFASVLIKEKWGLVDIKGNVIIPFEYDKIDNAFGTINAKKGDTTEEYKIIEGKLVKVPSKIKLKKTQSHINDYEEPTYERYNGSYAQDEMGYSDDDIDTIFDGDPLAYWNID